MMTVEEFRKRYSGSGESVMAFAELVINKVITDDDEFVAAAKEAVQAEDKFYVMLLERGMLR